MRSVLYSETLDLSSLILPYFQPIYFWYSAKLQASINASNLRPAAVPGGAQPGGKCMAEHMFSFALIIRSVVIITLKTTRIMHALAHMNELFAGYGQSGRST